MERLSLLALDALNAMQVPDCPYCGERLKLGYASPSNNNVWMCEQCGDFSAGYLMRYPARLDRLRRRWGSKHGERRPVMDVNYEELETRVLAEMSRRAEGKALTFVERYGSGRIPRGDSRALTFDEMVRACKNIGYDLTCGQCAAIFYTGVGTYPHDESCSTTGVKTS